MELLHRPPLSGSPQDSGRDSPLGLFEKFQLEPLPSPTVDCATHTQVDDSQELLSERKTDVLGDGPENGVCQRKSMLWVVESNTLCPAVNVEEKCSILHPRGVKIVLYNERSPYRLLGSRVNGCMELQRLEELENPLEEDVYIVEDQEMKPSNNERSPYKLLGSQVNGCMAMQRLEELENPLEEDVYIVEDQEMMPSNESGINGEIPFKICEDARRLFKPYGGNLIKKRKAKDHQQLKTGHLEKVSTAKKQKRSHPKEKIQAPQPLTAENVRGTAVQKLYDVLTRRVQDTPTLDVLDETVWEIAQHVEQEIFQLFFSTDIRYKNKYRSILFNLKDTKNTVLFHRVVLGEITPQCLVQMSATDLAGQELTNWRNQERRRALEIIEREQREPHKTQITKLTHKGLIEIDMDPDQNLSLEDLSNCMYENQAPQLAQKKDTTSQHRSHLLDSDCLICTGQVASLDEVELNQWRPQKNQGKVTRKTSVSPTDTSDLCGGGRKSRCLADPGLWKGFIHMYSIKPFKVTAFPVSGYSSSLCQEMCLIRFSPRSSSDATSYTRLFSYLNRKFKYGIVRSHSMEAFVVPLPACQPIPPRLHPLGGPGLEDKHPILLLALLLPRDPSWTACPRKTTRKQKKVVDIPENIFSDILADVEWEERQMLEQGLPPLYAPTSEQDSQCFEDGGEEVGMQEVLNMLHILSNNFMPHGENPGMAGGFQYASEVPGAQDPNSIPVVPQFPVLPCYPTTAMPNFNAPPPNYYDALSLPSIK